MLTLWYDVTLITIKRNYITVDNIFVMRSDVQGKITQQKDIGQV